MMRLLTGLLLTQPPQSLVDYEALRKVFQTIGKRFATSRIGYPKIGAGLAGGDWRVIEAIIDAELQGLDHTLVILQ